MYIDTHSIDDMMCSISEILSLTKSELIDEMIKISETANNDNNILKDEIKKLIKENANNDFPDEILFYHLTRRLDESKTSFNLLKLLTTDNEVSSMFKKFEIEFYEKDNHIETLYEGKIVDWENCKGNNSYMKSRLGYYNNRQDYCINGFLFEDKLNRNRYAINLRQSPEFVINIANCLECQNIVDYYRKKSEFYCYVYKLPLNRVIFDDNETYSYVRKQNYLIECVIERIIKSLLNDNDENNPILRLVDDDNLMENCFMRKEIINSIL